ncbi:MULTISPECIES: nicotinate-nucleotide--dimethylbenzimidazole phosphoribosyltransferase [unclassified Polaribacter]|uniref:nicotinate-nucleotide--dimethylbenzimidazole phosphoribosyltransferase n=1 Tax=unclassified Polaribacter TaxID=196858 RepID=UPI0011BDFFC2|nr:MULTISPECIES: nicotinate-nucleotide--dimethylbenzimidazole phosphoribosyltransferase [unclassified Polaribacter]TXD52489.1 nicotinate-nucleotide--dimethylbenzimidazole phosphoribosyltransferase [Polaribacter sp. IC063]TXD60475.1 nicotinate-nucleotide--dimethylbenzimidazole phosphoribosyltransferase [Polaribacter sp. IC066]
MISKITPLNKKLEAALQKKIDFKTKPLGSLGMLETIAIQIGRIQNTLSPKIIAPTIVVFAGDHGIVNSKAVSPYPQKVTQQMVFNFLNGGAAINVFCKQNNINLKIVDAGVNGDFEKKEKLIQAKIAKGTKDFYVKKAMTLLECTSALEKGKEIVKTLFDKKCNTIGFGEMGIGNTSSAALLMSYFTNITIEDCVGKGTGLDNKGLEQKKLILKEVYEKHIISINSPKDALTAFGGFEIVMITGAILEAAALKMTILIDGFIVTAALLAANAMDKNVLDYCIFTHTSGEQGHQKIINFLNVQPVLNLGLRLGEGTGAAVALPIIQSATQFLNEMATFESANVSEA